MQLHASDTNGFTLLELLIVTGVTAMLLALMAPYLMAMRTSWTQIDRRTEMLQNTRVAFNYIERELSQAQKIISVTSSTDPMGQIVFQDVSGNTKTFKRATLNGLSMIVLDKGGVVSALAGPVTSFILVAKDRETLAATQVPASIKSMDINLQMADEEGKLSAVDYSTTVYFQKDWVSAFYYGLYAYGTMTLSGSGTIVGDLRANQTISNSGITVTGTLSQGGNSLGAPTYNVREITTQYETPSSYKSLATVIFNEDYTFAKNSTYTGFYYIGSGHSAKIEQNVVINGTIVAEGSVDVTKQHVTINPAAGNPGIICGASLSIIKDLICNGTVFAKIAIDISGSDVSIVASTGHKMALGTLGNINFSGGTLSVSGMIVSQGSTTLSNVSTISLTAPSKYAAIVAKGLSVTGGTFSVNGALISKGDIYINTSTATISGILASAGNVTLLSNVTFSSDTTVLQDPMAYVFTQ